MRTLHRLIVAAIVLHAVAARSERVVLPAGTSLTVEDGMRIQNRAKWIKERLSKFILPNASAEDVSLQDYLELLRVKTSQVLGRAEESDNHIHFLRCGPGQEDIRVSLKLTDTSILGVCEALAKRIGARLHIVDYAVLFEVPLTPAVRTGKDTSNPFDQR